MSTGNRAALTTRQVCEVRQMMFDAFCTLAVQQLLPITDDASGKITLDQAEFTWSLKPTTQTKDENHEAR